MVIENEVENATAINATAINATPINATPINATTAQRPHFSTTTVCDAGVMRLLRADLRYLMRNKSKSRARVWAVALTNRGFHALILYRLAHALTQRHIPILPLLLTRFSQAFFAIDIDARAQLGPAIVIVHGFGIVIGNEAVIEGECVIFHGVTLGNKGTEWLPCDDEDGQPVVGKNCILSAGAKLLGPIWIGDNCIVGANAVVTKDVAESQIVGGVPARVLKQRPPLGRISYMNDWMD